MEIIPFILVVLALVGIGTILAWIMVETFDAITSVPKIYNELVKIRKLLEK